MAKFSVFKTFVYAVMGFRYRRPFSTPIVSNTPPTSNRKSITRLASNSDSESQTVYAASIPNTLSSSPIQNSMTIGLDAEPVLIRDASSTSLKTDDIRVVPSEPERQAVFRRGDKAQTERDIKRLAVAFTITESVTLKNILLALIKFSKTVDMENSEASQHVVKAVLFCEACALFIVRLSGVYGKDVQSSRAVIELLRLLEELDTLVPTHFGNHAEEQIKDEVYNLVCRLTKKVEEIKREYPHANHINDQLKPLDLTAQSKIDTMLGISITILDLLRSGCDLVPPPCVKPAVNLAYGLLMAVNTTRTNYQDMRDLSETTSDFVLSIAIFTHQNGAALPTTFTNALTEFNNNLCDIVNMCISLAQKPLVSRFLQQAQDANTMKGLKYSLNQAIDKFQAKTQILLYTVTKSINDKLDGDVIRNLPRNPVFEGFRDDFLPDIQDDILKQIASWIEDPLSDPVFLLSGSAGLGKTSVSHQLVYHLMETGRLAAQIFFIRGSITQCNLITIIQTLAHELGSMHPQAIPGIAAATRQGGSSHQSSGVYFQRFILDPIQSLSLPHPLVIVLDALDECEIHHLLLQAFSEIRDFSGIKIFITSRPGIAIRDSTSQPQILRVNLRRLSQDKMERYISTRFNNVHWTQDSPSKEDISNLAKLADGLLIWAATSCNLIEDDMQEDDPKLILQKIISSSKDIASEDQMANLYHTTLMHIFGKKDHVGSFLHVFQAMFVVQEAMSVQTFALAFGFGVRQTNAVHSALSSLEIYETIDKGIIIPVKNRFHASFLDYITQRQLPAFSNPFYIDPLIAHANIADKCIRGIQIFASSSNYRQISSLHDLEQPIKYAVYHWPFHAISGNQIEDDMSRMDSLKKMADSVTIWGPFYQLGSQALSLALEGSGSRQSIDKAIIFHTYSRQLFEATGMSEMEASSDFGFALWKRYEQNGSLKDLEDSISMQSTFLATNPAINLLRAQSLSRLGISLWGHFMTSNSSAQDLEQAISVLNESLRIYATLSQRPNHTVKALASALRTRFEETGSERDLDEAIILHKTTLELASPEQVDLTMVLNNLANCLISRFEQTNLTCDLDEAISILRSVIKQREVGHPYRPSTLNNLAFCLQHRYEGLGNMSDLYEAIDMNYEVLESRPVPHCYRAQTLTNLAACLQYRYDAQGLLSDLDDAILLVREAVELRPAPHPYHYFTVNRLGNYLHIRFRHQTESKDITEAIKLMRGVVASCPNLHRDYPIFQNDLSTALRSRYEETVIAEDLDDALMVHRQALASCPQKSVDYPTILSQLGTTLLTSYNYWKSEELLDEIIRINREANQLRPNSHPYRFQTLNNLARSLHYAFLTIRRQEDLDEARAMYYESLDLCPSPHPSRPIALEGLAHLAQSSFEVNDSLEHLDEWINRCRELFTLVLPSRVKYKDTFEGFQKALRTRFERKDEQEDLNEVNCILYQE